MNTIYDGTYVIGQTSATNFVAGPGIKIDEPSEGTVRIGNDETVLWESDYSSSTTTLTLSESYLNFEIIAVYWSHNNVTNEVRFYYTPAVDKSASKKARWMCRSGRENSGNIYDFCAVWIQDTETKFDKSVCFYRITGPSTNTNGTAANELVPIKVIGINRISGGNE